MSKVLLTTLTAKYIHAGFGLRYILANMGGLRGQTVMREFDINQKPLEITEKILAEKPVIVGFGVYIWNVTETHEVVSALRRIAPDIKIILGGPEVSYETETHPLLPYADYIIKGEADMAFAQLCSKLLGGITPEEKIIDAGFVDIAQLALPYGLYSEDDIAHRIVYVEASRGCPFTCEFCLSSLDIPVRHYSTGMFVRLAFATSTAVDPQILLLDEVMAGLNPSELGEIVSMIRAVRDGGVTILLIEHIMAAVAALAEEVNVMAEGALIARGTPTQIARDPAVVEAYLGHGAAARMAQSGARHA